MFRREPVLHGHDDRVRRVREPAGDGVVHVDAAEHPSTAVQVDNHWQPVVG